MKRQWIILPYAIAAIALPWALPTLAKNPPLPDPAATEHIMSWTTFAIGLIGALFGAFSWWRGAIVKSYAAERDFGHLRRNQEMISQAVAQLGEEIEALNRDIDQAIELGKDNKQQLDLIKMQATEAKGTLLAVFQQTQVIAAKIDSNTAGWTRTELR